MTLLDILPSLHRAVTPRIDRSIWPHTTHLDDLGRLCIGGVPLTDLADEYRTPTYIFDEEDFRQRIKRYRSALPGVGVTYAGKAFLTAQVAQWVGEEGIGLDVCSGGELAVALSAGFDPKRIILHGNAKTPEELQMACGVGVGRVVIDSGIEIAFLSSILNAPQRVLLRVTPDVDVHGHRAVATGIADQKFGFGLARGHAAAAVSRILSQPSLDLVGVHCHIGSQVTDAAHYGEAIHRMIAFMADILRRDGVVFSELNIGGGHGVPYVREDRGLVLEEFAAVVDDALETACTAERFPRPHLVIEPGRAISARAGVTLYRVVGVKMQPGGRTFVAVDGGMSDNPRVALYGAQYTVALANRRPTGPTRNVSVVGRHCEAGDEIARDVELPADIHAGDLLAVACTGAYHHSMASNYNMVCRPAVVAVRERRARPLVRRETLEDLLARDTGVKSG